MMDYRNGNWNSNNMTTFPYYGGNSNIPANANQSYQPMYVTPNYTQSQVMQNQYPLVYFPGRMVEHSTDVNAAEVPMNSPINIFPKNDLSEIYIKSWGKDGTIQTNVYTKQDVDVIDMPNQSSDDILNRLNHIEELLDSLSSQIFQKKNPNQNKRPVANKEGADQHES